MSLQVKDANDSNVSGRRQYLGPLLLSMAWVVRSLKERFPLSMWDVLPAWEMFDNFLVFMMIHSLPYALIWHSVCIYCGQVQAGTAMLLSCIECFRCIIYIDGCRCPELAGISDVFPMNKILLTHFCLRFLPQDAMKHVDVQCWDTN